MLVSNELLLVIAVALVLIVLLVYLVPRSDRERESGDEADSPLVEDYPDKRLRVTVAWQGVPVRVLRLPYAALAETRSDNDEFQPVTPLLNVVVAREDDPDQLVTRFDPPLELVMGYSAKVLQDAHEVNLEHPLFGFWDGCKWVRFTAEKHGLEYQRPEHPAEDVAEQAVVRLAAWSDPLIARFP
jgi:hypothetical protein